MSSYGNYRDILKSHWQSRRRTDPRFSLTSFAQHLGISPSRLCEIFQGKQGLSRSLALQIGDRIGLAGAHLEYFADLVEAEHARGAQNREWAKQRLKQSALAQDYHVLNADAFHVMSDWYHFGILQLTELKEFQNSPEWIGARLNISPIEAELALERLLKLELLERDETGLFRKTKDYVATLDGVPSSAVKKFHKQILEKAIKAIDEQSVDARSLSANFLNVAPSRMNEAKGRLKRFRRKFIRDFGAEGENAQAVHCLSIQFFSLTEDHGDA